MNKPHQLIFLFLTATLTMTSGCSTIAQKPAENHSQFKLHQPKSILVLPPVNNSVDVQAPYTYLSTVTKPLVELGYYVFPVSLINQQFVENGRPNPIDMHQTSLEKINEIIGADAVFYVTITDWGQKYQVLSSSTIAAASAKLVDVKTGKLLWQGGTKVQISSNQNNSNGIAGLLISALIEQVVKSKRDDTPMASRALNQKLLRGWPKGPRFPKPETSPQ